MTAAGAYAPVQPPARPRSHAGTAQDVVVAGVVALVLVVVGVLAGFGWTAWSPARPPAQVLGGGQYIPDETESFIAGDGRYLVITAAVGFVAALLVWFLRPGNRGVAVAAGLVLGGLAGAALTELIGHLTGGGSATGRVVTDASGAQFRVTQHLPLSLHMSGLVVVEAALAALVYGVLVAFAADDDLARPDPVRERLRAAAGASGPAQLPVPPYGFGSVDAGGHPQYGGGHGDAAGPAQQGDLPPQ